jgi:hypothetical protein
MPETGISFTEFLEALAWVAVRGMRADGEGEGEGKEAGGGVGGCGGVGGSVGVG